jgi:two-component system, cell cycle sensor histidine kinase and response regulator CckA
MGEAKKKKPISPEIVKLRSQIEEMQDACRRAEDACRESEKRYREIFNEAPIGFHELDREGRIMRVNRTELEMLGCRAEEMLGRPVWSFIVEEEMTRKITLAKLEGDRSFHETFERTYRRKDDKTLQVLVKDQLIRDKEGRITGIRSMMEDITERRRTEEALRKSEEQLRQWQKVEAIGRLAGGVAHDFNNLLTTITGCTEDLIGQFERRDPRLEGIKEIHRAAERATALTRQLLAFGRRQVLHPQVLNLNGVVGEMEHMLRRLIGEDLELVTLLAPEIWSVKVDRGQIEQVVMNLALNARDAIPEGGKVTIETANLELDEEYARTHVSAKPGAYVMLAISDTGCGMDKETQSHLFEPFFTTKEKGKGTGLGLSTVYGIVKQSGGNIWAYSEPGRGSTFKIYLPRVQETAGRIAESRPAPSSEVRGGVETILLVEDEESVRKMVGKILGGQGYTILEAAHGDEAIRVCGNHKGPIHLLMTDVIMPRMSGRELAETLRPLRKEMKVLYMSGYPDNTIVHHGVLEPGTAFLQKPFSLRALEQKVREVLDTAPEVRNRPTG